jgi:hypothetical protein
MAHIGRGIVDVESKVDVDTETAVTKNLTPSESQPA